MRRRWLLPVADALALAGFVLAGLARHVEGFALHLIARNLLPLLAAWFLVGALLGIYRRPEPGTFVLTWLTSVTAATAARSLWLGHPRGRALVTFLLVSLSFTLLALLLGRGLAWLVDRALDGGYQRERRSSSRRSRCIR
ncbi:MAG TPA: DUF3054 family protein [Actinomycetota bacterium]|nr:DUF3054 family protein [Actinomycetota bacterium]